jgi:sec-independent protein translocase protein TatB
MFDIGFSEVLVIFVLALVVLGPEKLPKVAAQVGRWIGRARGMARQFREQLEEEVNFEETRRAQAAVSPPSPSPVPLAAPATDTPATWQAAALPTETSAATMAPAAEASAGAPVPEAQATAPADAPAATAPTEPEQQIVYPDTYSHAHPTDSLGRPVAAPNSQHPAVEPGQQDWVGAVTDKPAQTAADAAYAPPHERGT